MVGGDRRSLFHRGGVLPEMAYNSEEKW